MNCLFVYALFIYDKYFKSNYLNPTLLISVLNLTCELLKHLNKKKSSLHLKKLKKSKIRFEEIIDKL